MFSVPFLESIFNIRVRFDSRIKTDSKSFISHENFRLHNFAFIRISHVYYLSCNNNFFVNYWTSRYESVMTVLSWKKVTVKSSVLLNREMFNYHFLTLVTGTFSFPFSRQKWTFSHEKLSQYLRNRSSFLTDFSEVVHTFIYTCYLKEKRICS